MTSLLFLIPAALALGGMGLLAFLWALKSGQYDDLDGAALRVLDDADLDRRAPRDLLPRRESRTDLQSQYGQSR